jgi:hypothetical protein
MKSWAVARGVLVSAAYAEACALFLATQAKRKKP